MPSRAMPTTGNPPTSTSKAAFLRIPAVAESIGCSVATVRRRIADGSLASVRFGALLLVPRTEIDRLVRSAL